MPRFRPMALTRMSLFCYMFSQTMKNVTFKYFISDVLQRSIVGPVLVNLSPSDDAPSAFCLVSISNNEVTSKEK